MTLISGADAIEAVCGVVIDVFNVSPTFGYEVAEKALSALPSAEAEPMTEEVREALMRLTMCAREECGMCKYKDECGFDFQYKISTDNMNTLADALMRSKCEVDAKSAEAEWIPVSEKLPNENARYLVQMSYGLMQVLSWANVLEKVDDFDFYNEKHGGWYELDSEWGYCERHEVVAWMPLPEPYREDDE